MPLNNLSFHDYNKQQILLSKHHQNKLARNNSIDLSGEWRINHSMKTEDVINKLAEMGINTNVKQLQRYSREYNLMPKPTTKKLGQGKGSITIYPDDAVAEFVASYSLREGFFLGAKYSVGKIAEVRELVKRVEGTITRIDDSLNCSHAVNNREYRFLINNELADLIEGGSFGSLSYNKDNKIIPLPNSSLVNLLTSMMAQTWIILKIKALAGFNPANLAVEYSMIKNRDQCIVHIFERKP